jgi:hypothetical protein
MMIGTLPELQHVEILLSIPPLVVAGIVYGAGKLLQGLFGHLSAEKKAAALKKAQENLLKVRSAAHDVDETRRVGRLDASQGMLKNVQGSLAPGTPDYSMSPANLATLETRRPFDESLPPDPKAGLGSEYLAGLSGTISDFAKSYAAGQGGGGGGSIIPQGGGGISGSALGQNGTAQPFSNPNPYLNYLKYNPQAQNPWGS